MSETETLLDIKQAAEYLGLGEQYVRILIRRGVLPTKKIPTREGAETKKHVMRIEDLDAFRARKPRRSGPRADGRNRYILYATPDEIEGIRELVALHYPEVEVKRAHESKVPPADDEE